MDQKLIESLSPNERKILPYVEEKEIANIAKKANLDKTSVMRALTYLENKNILKIHYERKTIIEIGLNGALYKKKGLPERRLLSTLAQKRMLPLKHIQKETKLSGDEIKASVGVLKRKALITVKNDNIIFNAQKEEIAKKMPEEVLLEQLPLEKNTLTKDQLVLVNTLEKRKDIIRIKEEKILRIEIQEIGRKLMQTNITKTNLIEQLTPELLKKETLWKNKKFRRYDVKSNVPEIYGGKKHFVNQAIDYARKIWTEMGFVEMTGSMIQNSFWNFDALFTAQDHPVREMQDTFFINKKGNLPDEKLVKATKKAHEEGTKDGSGWNYKWDSEIAKKLVLRTHTTCLSAKFLYSLKEKDLPKKYFSIGKCFRNEAVDWSHGFEFYQTEGIVVDPNVTFRDLLGYLKEFYKKMGFEKIRFAPAYFPYTEPSVEVNVWHKEKKVWLELGGAGIFRPEVTVPLLGKPIPVLAWGQGFDRIITDYYKIKDLRELYKNNLKRLREIKYWMK